MGPGFYKDAAPAALDTWFPILYCGGKRSATPLSYARKASEHLGHFRALESAVVAALCRRSTNGGTAGWRNPQGWHRCRESVRK